MKKFLFATILALALFAVSVNAVSSFNIVQDFVNETKSAGQTVSSSFTVNNDGTEDLNINFTGLALNKGTDQLNITSLSNITNLLSSSTPRIATFSVVIPSQQVPGLYTGTLTGTSNNSDVDTVIINVNVTPTYTVSTSVSEINLGGLSLNSTGEGTFDITNTGNAEITSALFDFTESGFNLQANKSNFTLAKGATETIVFNITIPASSSTGNVTLGSVRLVSTELSKTLFIVKAEVGGGLTIEDLDVFLSTRIQRRSDGTLGSESGNDLDVYDGRKLRFGNENAGPESEIRFNFNIENTFSDKEDIDINDITVKVTIEEIDDGEDIEEESREFDLDSDSSEDVDIFVNIPLSVDVGVYDVVIEVIGEDDDGNEHTAQMNLKIDIDKEARAVVVSEASLFPGTIKCKGTSTLTATIKNIGSRTEDEAGIEIINSDLGINFVKQDIELEEDPFDSDNEFTRKMRITVAKSIGAGTYPITVNSYIHDGAIWETKTVNLIVEACSGTEEEEINETESVEIGQQQADEEDTTAAGETIPVLGPTTTTEVPLTKKPGFWVAVIVLNVVLIGGAVFLGLKSAGKK